MRRDERALCKHNLVAFSTRMLLDNGAAVRVSYRHLHPLIGPCVLSVQVNYRVMFRIFFTNLDSAPFL